METIPEDQLVNIQEILQYLAAIAVGFIMRLFQKRKQVKIGEDVLSRVKQNPNAPKS